MNWQEVELRDYLKIVVRHKRFIICGALLSALVAGAFSFIMPQTYQSSLILEIGKIYLPPREMTKQEVEFIEDPDSTAKVIEGDAVLDKVREQLKLDVTLKDLREQLEVRTFVEAVSANPQKMGSSLVGVTWEAHSPRECVDFLNALAALIVKQHAANYEANHQALENRIKNLQEKLGFIEKVVSAQVQYRQEIQASMNKVEQKADEYGQQLSKLEPSRVSPAEFLFLQSFASEQRKGTTDLNEILTELEVAIGENQEKLGDFKDEIVNIKSLIELSTPTKVRSPAILPDRPCKPHKLLNIIIGGVLGLMITVLTSFFRAYWKNE